MLTAAGRGERLGEDRPKAFARLGDLPLVAEPLRRLEESDWIDGIVVTAPPGWEEPCIVLAEELGAGKVASVVTGGETRSASVRLAVAEVPDDVTVIVVHDAARPILPEDVLERVLRGLTDGWDGVVPVLPAADTVKRVGADGAVVETLDRESLAFVQTPQAFVASALRQAVSGLQPQSQGFTDCASMVEARGGRIRTVPGDKRLLKVTSPEDLLQVSQWL